MKRTKTSKAYNIERHRNVAHLWADKQVIRFFRKYFEPIMYKNLRSVYLALCEMDSDFGQGSQINAFTSTVGTYAGMDVDTIRPYLLALKESGIIDYWQEQDATGRFGQSQLILFKWDNIDLQQKADKIMSMLSGDSRSRKKPLTGKAVDGFSSPFKNNNKLLSNYKNKKIQKKESETGSKDGNKQILPIEEVKKYFPKSWIDNEDFQTSIETYFQHRKEKNNPLRPSSTKMLANKLKKTNLSIAIEALDRSVQNGWTGVFPESIKDLPNSDNAIPPETIIEEYFAGSANLSEFFIRDCYEPAEDLVDPSTEQERSMLATKLITLYDQIAKSQKLYFTIELVRLLPSSMRVVENYIKWIYDNLWIQDKSLNLFTIDHKLFSKYRRFEAACDNMERDPLTGKSYIVG